MSFENPTRDFLNTLKKTELRNHCCELGIKGIWSCNKQQLIELLLEKCQSQSKDGNSIELQEEETTEVLPTLRKLLAEIQEMKEKLAIKEVEVEDIYEQLKTSKEELRLANENIYELQETVKTLQVNRQDLRETGSHDVNMTQYKEEGKATLLIGDSNLRNIRSSDLKSCCKIRTIHDANISALRSWISDQLD